MTRRVPILVLTLVPATLIVVALLVLPGRTVITAYINDVFIFLDGAWRVVSGQAPNRDFHSALGPLVFWLPAAALAISGDFGNVMPGATALSVLLLLPPLLHVAGSRLTTVLGVPFALFLLAVAAMPVNLGEKITSLSYAMFYNRTGWAFFALLLVMHLSPRRPVPPLLDAAVAAFLTLTLIYTKATYGVFALVFLAFEVLYRPARRWALPALAITAAGGLLVEAFWGGTAGHLADLAMAAGVSGASDGTKVTLGLLRHIPDLTFLALMLALLMLRRPRGSDIPFFGLCIVSGLWILQQNAQPWGILSLHAAAVVAAERLLRSAPARDRIARGAPLLLIAMLAPTVVHGGLALGLHAVTALSDETTPIPLPRFEGVRVARLASGGDPGFTAIYLPTLADGARALAPIEPRPGRVTVLDFSNPFSAGIGLAPPTGDFAWLHWNRNIDMRNAPAAERLFSGSDYVMVPKRGINAVPLIELYGDHLANDFVVASDTEFWSVHRRRTPTDSARDGAAR